jgi:hypothetical protein
LSSGSIPFAIAVPTLVLIASLLVFHHTTIASGFALTQGEFGDSMLVNYALEHDYRWLAGNRLDNSLWSPPIFYPQHDTAAYTDLMLGALPPYAFWRMYGAQPMTAFQLWMITVSALNFLSAYWLLRYVLECGWIGSSAGALLFAFGSPRIIQIGHPQLLPAFYMVIAFAGVVMLFKNVPDACTPRRVYVGLTLFLGGFCLQFYSAFYYAWFMAFTVVLGLVFAFLLPGSRSHVVSFIRHWWRASFIAGFLAALVIAPYIVVAWRVLRQVGGYPYFYLTRFLPSTKAWLAQGPDHLFYGTLNRWAGVGPDYGSREMFDGIGLLTTALVILGFILFRARPLVRLWGLVTLSVILLSYHLPGDYSLWHIVYACFPGASAVRCVGRIGLYLLLPASIALAFLLDRIGARFSIAAIACLLAVGLEQAGSLHDAAQHGKAAAQASVADVTRHIGPECGALLFSWSRAWTSPEIMQIIGMWAELRTGVPSLNGYSGQFPPHWPLTDVSVSNVAERDQMRQNIERWMASHPADFKNVCWVLPEDGVKPRSSMVVLSLPDAAGGKGLP